MVKIVSLVLFSETWNTVGQLLFKRSTNQLEAPHSKDPSSYLRFIKNILGIPSIWLGLGSMAVGLSVWLIVLAQGDLSLIFPIGSSQYIFTLITAKLFLGEKIGSVKLTGTLLVVLGILCIAAS